MRWPCTCQQCFHVWMDRIGMFAEHMEGCPKCLSRYWRQDVPKIELDKLSDETITDK